MTLQGYVGIFDEHDRSEGDFKFDHDTQSEYFLYPIGTNLAIRVDKYADFVDIFYSGSKLDSYDKDSYTPSKTNCYDMIFSIFENTDFIENKLKIS